ncbi:AbrB/MazE/SpoVT family DNA-binding domain-containing protein [Lentzea sp. NPDC004782]|uniref:AbrB/MazE/SpoVT family DNA-binding domain-containing protein n=1 Tax=Lentzea sp. NPDC004782 TaxID=3154458 RepID=UPI0033B043B2
MLYRMAAVDHRGRVADRHVTAALDWNAGTRLSIREHHGLLVATADPHGVFKPTKEGYLRLPADARRAADLSSGDRVLLTAHLDRQSITVFPPFALDQLVLPVLPGGEDE